MKVLVDSSVWIAHFRGAGDTAPLEWMIEKGVIVTNDLIPDLIIAQHAIQNDLALFSLDGHFAVLARHLPLNLH